MVELIYALEPLAYYFDLKPGEFWNARYSEINIYCQTHIVKVVDDLKREINLQEAVTNKLIRADSMSRNPKIVSIRGSYKELFKEEQQPQSPEDIARRMRSIMKTEKNI